MKNKIKARGVVPKLLVVKKIDVKEFIKRREEDLHDINNGSLTPAQALAKLRKDAGPKLIK